MQQQNSPNHGPSIQVEKDFLIPASPSNSSKNSPAGTPTKQIKQSFRSLATDRSHHTKSPSVEPKSPSVGSTSSTKKSLVQQDKEALLVKKPSLQKTSSIFSSKVPRFSPIKSDSPPATAYFPNLTDSHKTPTKSPVGTGFSTQSPRFSHSYLPSPKQLETPPVGAYELSKNATKQIFTRPKSAFGSSTDRFKVSKNHPPVYTPGVGFYETTVIHELVDTGSKPTKKTRE